MSYDSIKHERAKEFTERLAQLRTAKNVSARDMSLSLGQNDSYINRIELNKSLPSLNTFFYICDYLNITPKDFFDEETHLPTSIKELNQYANKLDEQSLNNLIGVARKMAGEK